ncbi:hypothetical protein DC74_8096 [Streptomyces noursei]|nr:hypothetical protein DC74_8096 [Streptomyces noursei]
MADAAGRGVDQHVLTGPESRGVDEGLPGGERGERQSGRLDVVDPGRLGREGAGGSGHVLGVGTGPVRVGQHAEHLVTGPEEGDPVAGLHHGAGDVPAEGQRRGRQEDAQDSVLEVRGVESGGVHGDEDLAGAGRGPGKLGQLEDFGAAEGRLVQGVITGAPFGAAQPGDSAE